MNKTKDLVIIAIFSAIIFVQEEVLTFLPNIQLTVFLLILYTKMLGFKKTMAIILIHVTLDNLVMGSINMVYTPFMLLGWSLIPILLTTIFKRVNQSLGLAYFSILAALLYSWIYLIPSVLIMHVNPLAYLASDILFELLLASSSFLSTLWLYNPCAKAMQTLLNKTYR